LAAIIAPLMVICLSADAQAQLKGHYIPGFTGLGNGTQPPASISLGVPIYLYRTDTLKDGNGNTIGVNPQVNEAFTGFSMAMVTNAKVFGANYGFQVLPVDAIKSLIETNSLDVSNPLAISDITFTPVWLGWHKKRADFLASYGFFVPTGEWELGGSDNSGLGMWSHDFQFGTTVHLDDKKEWTTSVLATYEIHTHKNDTDITVGDILTIEGGTGRAFYDKVTGTAIPRITNVGVVYYTQLKVTADTGFGPLVDDVLANSKDRVFGIGGEVNVFLPKPKLLLGVRVVPEFGAHTRTQGLTVLFTVGYQAKSLVKTP
jgi:hypothetical protein